MKEKMKAHFLKFGPRRFVVATVLILLITDIINSYYLKLYWLKKDLSHFMVLQNIQRSDLQIQDFSQTTIDELAGFVNNAFYFFLLLIFANNLFFYLFYLRKKLWAQGYVLFYTLTAALFSLTFIFDNAGLGLGWMSYNILVIPVYIYLYFGVKLLKLETTHLHEKKGR
jgi:hypothetical protein